MKGILLMVILSRFKLICQKKQKTQRRYNVITKPELALKSLLIKKWNIYT